MPQTVVYEGDADIAVLGLFHELLRPDRWSPGEWYIEVEHSGVWEGEDLIVSTITKGHLMEVRDVVPNESGSGFHGEVTIEPWDVQTDTATGPEVTLITDEIIKVVVT